MRSDDDVAATVSCCTSLHVLVAPHAAPSTASENVAPTVHGEHWRSAVEVPSIDRPEPSGQVLHDSHDALPSLDAY